MDQGWSDGCFAWIEFEIQLNGYKISIAMGIGICNYFPVAIGFEVDIDSSSIMEGTGKCSPVLSLPSAEAWNQVHAVSVA